MKTEIKQKSMEFRKNTGLLLRDRRVQLGLSQTDLANELGVRYQTIGRIELGQFSGSIDLINAIATKLGLKIIIKK